MDRSRINDQASGPVGCLLFWSALGYVGEQDSVVPYRRLLPAGGDGVELLLQRVSEPKVIKNRVHLDLRVPDLEDEVARLVAWEPARTSSMPAVLPIPQPKHLVGHRIPLSDDAANDPLAQLDRL